MCLWREEGSASNRTRARGSKAGYRPATEWVMLPTCGRLWFLDIVKWCLIIGKWERRCFVNSRGKRLH